MKVAHHQRLGGSHQVSIERLFEGIRREFDPNISVELVTSPYLSKGVYPRIRNLFNASRQKADVHHILGDAHYLAFGLPASRLVLTIHDCATLNRLTGWKREVLKRLWFSGPIRRAAVVTTISETTKAELRTLIGPIADRCLVIPNCVRAEFVPSPKTFRVDCPVILQVGTGWNKNIERVCRAIQHTNCLLEVVGQFNEEQRALIDSLGIPFRVLGRVSDSELVNAFQRCDILIFASLYEGFGLPILEAQATGRPVITSNCSAMPEASGAGALLVDPTSVESIHCAIKALVRNAELRDRLVTAGFENVQKYKTEVIAAQYAKVYEKVNPLSL